MMFLEILLSLTKPEWLREFNKGRIGVNLRQRILEMILLVKLLRLIGLKPASLLGWFAFDSRTKHA